MMSKLCFTQAKLHNAEHYSTFRHIQRFPYSYAILYNIRYVSFRIISADIMKKEISNKQYVKLLTAYLFDKAVFVNDETI